VTTDVDVYRTRFSAFLTGIAENLEAMVRDDLDDTANIDRITARAKDPDRFAAKTEKLNEDGTLKYAHPLTEIQDQIGVRVIVLYLGDVQPVFDALARYFQAIEETALVPESPWAFGYFGRHAVMGLPDDAVPSGVDLAEAPRFFELQVKTLFQHAWSEANHDLGYKNLTPPSVEQQRRLAFTAAQAWGADHIFEELRCELAP
jgi:putative GTP pyrophosphokinase